MMKKLILILGLLPLCCIAQDFKSFSWGDPIEKVKKLETSELTVGLRDVLFYETSVSGMDANLSYSFANNQLYMAMYIFTERHTSAGLFITDFEKLVSLLVSKYGEPEKRIKKRNDTLFEDDPGMAVVMGGLELGAVWVLENTFIYVSLAGDKGDAKLSLGYKSKKIQDGRAKDEMNKL